MGLGASKPNAATANATARPANGTAPSNANASPRPANGVPNAAMAGGRRKTKSKKNKNKKRK